MIQVRPVRAARRDSAFESLVDLRPELPPGWALYYYLLQRRRWIHIGASVWELRHSIMGYPDGLASTLDAWPTKRPTQREIQKLESEHFLERIESYAHAHGLSGEWMNPKGGRLMGSWMKPLTEPRQVLEEERAHRKLEDAVRDRPFVRPRREPTTWPDPKLATQRFLWEGANLLRHANAPDMRAVGVSLELRGEAIRRQGLTLQATAHLVRGHFRTSIDTWAPRSLGKPERLALAGELRALGYRARWRSVDERLLGTFTKRLPSGRAVARECGKLKSLRGDK